MKKRLLSLLLALTLALGLALPAAAAEDPLPKVGQTLHGFRVTGRDTLEVLDCPMITLEHVKSGASLCYIASGDANRTFDITFHTPALDDKGIPHIFEHITISGSERYPHQNIFFPAAYQTYNTFVNAMTDETTTSFPVSSLSEDQLLKLMDYYLDGVFHPMVYTEPRLFEREAWRYDLQSADAPITITGTVYNEMKGAIDIYRAADYNLQRLLFPGSSIGSNSGGDPDVIPTLTYQELLDFHDAYYHPSNALIVLYGDLDLGRFLKAMDEDYLSGYERREIAVPDGAIPPLTAPVSGRFEYPVEADSDTSRGAVVSYGMVANGADREETAALNILTDILSSDASPVAQAIREALPGASFSAGIDMNFPQTRVTFDCVGVEESDAPAFQAAVDRGLAELVEKGVDAGLAQGAVASAQLSLRSITESGQIGPSLASMLASRWAAEGRLDYLNFYSGALETMSGRADKGYFESVAEKYLIGNPHSGVAVTVPAAGLKEEREAALAKTLAAKKAAMTGAEIDALVQKTADFAVWTAEEAPRALVDSLKAVSVKDLPETLVDYPITDKTEGGVRYLTAEAQVSGISFTGLELSLAALPTGDLHWASLYASLLGKLDTDRHTANEIAALGARYLGNFAAMPSTLPRDGERYDPVLMVQWIGMDESYQTGLDLAGEVLFRTRLTDADAIRGLVYQLCQIQKSRLNASPDSAQYNRMMAAAAPEKYAAYDEMTGLAYYEFLTQVQSLLETDPAQVTARLAGVQKRLATRSGAVSLYAGSAESMAAQAKAIRAFWNALPETRTDPAGRSDLPRPAGSEAVVVDAAVQYNMAAAPLEDVGLTYSGKLPVLAALVSDQYLTPQIRQVIGAYGATVAFSEDALILGTYRDPSLDEAYRVMAGAGGAVAALDLTQEEIDGYIMSVYSEAARPRGALTGAANAMVYHMRGRDTASRVAELKEMKSVTIADVKALAPALDRLAEQGFRSTFGGAAAIGGAQTRFDAVLYPNGRAALPLTRAEAVSRLYGGAADALERAKADGVLVGDGSGDCLEESPLTREQLALLLYRLKAGVPAGEVPMTDLAAVSPWALEAVRWAAATGNLTLDSAGAFRPGDSVTAADLP